MNVKFSESSVHKPLTFTDLNVGDFFIVSGFMNWLRKKIGDNTYVNVISQSGVDQPDTTSTHIWTSGFPGSYYYRVVYRVTSITVDYEKF